MIPFDAGEIIPGERVGQFQLGTPWYELEQELTVPLEREQRVGYLVVKLPCIWFFINEATQRLEQITVLNQFRGTIGNLVGLGSTGMNVAATLGPWVEDKSDNLIVPDHPGVSFEIDFVPGHGVEWQLKHAPIAYISVYRP